MSIKRIVILGSTGSIGINALKVIERFQRQFKVIGLTAYNNFKLLEKQIRKFSPKYVAVNQTGMGYLRKHINSRKTKIFDVEKEINRIVEYPDVDLIVIGIRGRVALEPFLSAVRCGKTIAPANKEALVIAGDLIMEEARKHKALIIPIDSEQSAIFQCLHGRDSATIRKIHLTASGGALCNVPKSQFYNLTVERILRHPRWKMGRKITVDSATLMNKGFEVIETHRLFNIAINNIHVIVHPEAIIHSMVEFQDGSIIAQLSITDMRIPIQYALTYPKRFDSGLSQLNFFKVKRLTFKKPDINKFPSLALSFYVGQKGGSLPAVLNAADEEAVDAFLKGKIRFTGIYHLVEKVVMKHKIIKNPNLENLCASDKWAREEAKKIILN